MDVFFRSGDRLHDVIRQRCAYRDDATPTIRHINIGLVPRGGAESGRIPSTHSC